MSRSAESDDPSAGALPWAGRLPNAPAAFVGRAAELSWLRRAAKRGPVAVVWGEGGLGKSALVRQALRSIPAKKPAPVVYVSMRAADRGEPLAMPVLRALSRLEGQSRVDWGALLEGGESLSAHALSLAERGSRWVVLDDLHLAPPAEVSALLGLACRFARASRWVATLREPPRDEGLAGSLLSLGPLPSRDAAQLARRLAPSIARAEAEQIAALAQGSPWKLARLLRRGTTSPVPSPEQLERPASEAESRVLEALALGAVPLPARCVERAAGAGPELVDELVRRGLVERSGGLIALGDDAREAREAASKGARAAPPSLCLALGRELAAEGEPALQIAAVALLVAAGNTPEASSLLEARGEALLSSGHAPGLWSALSGALSPELDRWRLAAALEAGDALAQAPRAPTSGEPRAGLLWAKVLLSRGKAAEALSSAAEAEAGARRAGDRATAAEAALLSARALGNAGQLRESAARLAAIDDEAEVGALADAIEAQARSLLGERALASRLASAASERLAALPWPARGKVGYGVARSLYQLGHLREASACLDRATQGDGGSAVRFDVGRLQRFLRICLSVDGGQLDRAGADLAALEPHVGPRSLLRPHLEQARVVWLLARGNTDEALGLWVELEAGEHPPTFRQELEALGLRLSILRADGERRARSSGEGALFGRLNELLSIELTLRSGEASAEALSRALPGQASGETKGEASGDEHPEARATAARVRALARLLSGDAAGALALARAAADDAREHGLGVLEAESLELRCDALVSMGNHRSLEAAVAELEALARSMPSPRFLASARLFRAVGPGQQGAAGEIEAVARLGALPAGRRARALLGEGSPLDALDRLVLARLADLGWFRPPTRIGRPSSPPPASPGGGWGIDEARHEVWLPDGTRVPLGNHLMLWRLLSSLAHAGGRASKEQLVREVWGEADYHPLRHDNRLHALVRKLRQKLERDASSPERLLTTDEGYALAGVVRRVG